MRSTWLEATVFLQDISNLRRIHPGLFDRCDSCGWDRWCSDENGSAFGAPGGVPFTIAPKEVVEGEEELEQEPEQGVQEREDEGEQIMNSTATATTLKAERDALPLCRYLRVGLRERTQAPRLPASKRDVLCCYLEICSAPERVVVAAAIAIVPVFTHIS